MAMKHLAQTSIPSSTSPARSRSIRHPDRAVARCFSVGPIGLLPRRRGRAADTRWDGRPRNQRGDVIEAIDGPFTVTACSTEKNDCEQYSKCSIRDPLWQIRERIAAALGTVTLAEIAAENVSSPVPVSRAAVLHNART